PVAVVLAFRPGLSLRDRDRDRPHRAPVAGTVDSLCVELVTTPLELLRNACRTRMEPEPVEATAELELRAGGSAVTGRELERRSRVRRGPGPDDPRSGWGRTIGFRSRCSSAAGQKGDSADGCVLDGSLHQRAAPYESPRTPASGSGASLAQKLDRAVEATSANLRKPGAGKKPANSEIFSAA